MNHPPEAWVQSLSPDPFHAGSDVDQVIWMYLLGGGARSKIWPAEITCAEPGAVRQRCAGIADPAGSMPQVSGLRSRALDACARSNPARRRRTNSGDSPDRFRPTTVRPQPSYGLSQSTRSGPDPTVQRRYPQALGP